MRVNFFCKIFFVEGVKVSMIGEQLRTLRKANRMTQKELAVDLSVAFQTISNWENNSIDPSVNMIIRIADFFNCSTDYLLRGGNKSTMYIDTSDLTEVQHAHLLSIAREYARLNDNQIDNCNSQN
jgi:transcriptional regulator with XRE-family HTH domain